MSPFYPILRPQPAIKRCIQAVFAIATIICVLPQQLFSDLGTGLDPSWQLALQIAVERGFVFGTEFLFTYGPLGVVSTRLPFTSTVTLITITDCLFTLSMAVGIGWMAFKAQNVLALLLLFSTGLLLNFNNLFNADLVLCYTILLVALLFSLIIRQHSLFTKYLLSALAAILATAILLMKHNGGMFALVCVAIAIVVVGWRDRSPLFVAAAALVLLSTVHLGAWFFSVDLLPYLRGGLEISAGFNTVMMIWEEQFRPNLIVATALIGSFSAIALTIFARSSQKIQHGAMFTILGGFLFVVFKQSFVRGDLHALTASYFFPVAFLVLSQFFNGWHQALQQGLTTIALASSFYLLQPSLDPAMFANRIENFMSFVTEPRWSNKNLVSAAQYADRLSEKTSADILPWEISYLWSHGYTYQPRPVMQSYSAYTPYLDNLNAAFYKSSKKPDTVFFSSEAVDGRYHFWDEALTKQALLEHYKLNGRQDNMLVLTRREKPLHATVREVGEATVKFGQWINVPDFGNEFLYARIETSYSIIGKIKSLFYQTPVLNVRIAPVGEKGRVYRAVQTTLSSGVLINKFVPGTADAAYFFSNNPGGLKDVRRFKFSVESKADVAPMVKINFYTVTSEST